MGLGTWTTNGSLDRTLTDFGFPATTAQQLVRHGVIAGGGSLNNTTSLAVCTLLADGRYDEHLHALRREPRHRRETRAVRPTQRAPVHADWRGRPAAGPAHGSACALADPSGVDRGPAPKA